MVIQAPRWSVRTYTTVGYMSHMQGRPSKRHLLSSNIMRLANAAPTRHLLQGSKLCNAYAVLCPRPVMPRETDCADRVLLISTRHGTRPNARAAYIQASATYALHGVVSREFIHALKRQLQCTAFSRSSALLGCACVGALHEYQCKSKLQQLL